MYLFVIFYNGHTKIKVITEKMLWFSVLVCFLYMNKNIYENPVYMCVLIL